MRQVYFDCFYGATETMLLGALLALGVDLDEINEELKVLGSHVEATRTSERGLVATLATVLSVKQESNREMREVA